MHLLTGRTRGKGKQGNGGEEETAAGGVMEQRLEVGWRVQVQEWL